MVLQAEGDADNEAAWLAEGDDDDGELADPGDEEEPDGAEEDGDGDGEGGEDTATADPAGASHCSPQPQTTPLLPCVSMATPDSCTWMHLSCLAYCIGQRHEHLSKHTD